MSPRLDIPLSEMNNLAAASTEMVKLGSFCTVFAATEVLETIQRVPLAALVGYTNAGKSTLFNRLTGAEVMAKDMLFATLDPTMRAVTLPSGLRIILSDTVGFISALPTQLVAAFRATLEEVLSADLILHVRDIAHPGTEAQAEDVRTILADLGVDEDVPLIEVWNKIDQLPGPERATRLTEAARREHVYAASALTGEGLAEMLSAVGETLSPPRRRTARDDARTSRRAGAPALRGRRAAAHRACHRSAPRR